MIFDKFVTESKNGILVLRQKDGFGSLALLQLQQQIGSCCHKWSANLPIFGREKFTALTMT